MIVKLKGFIEKIHEDSVDLDVSGVVFRIFLSTRDLESIKKINDKIVINIHEMLRDDCRYFFGFLQLDEKSIFEDLIKVPGVGGKVALSIISKLSVEQIINTVKKSIVTNFTQISGIGQKVSQRLINELSDKIDKRSYLSSYSNFEKNLDFEKLNDLISCLNNLGYSQRVSEEVSTNLMTSFSKKNLEELIPMALKKIKNKS